MKRKIIPVLVALVLIMVIAGVIAARIWEEKYSYSTERADLDEYFGVSDEDELAIILQDDMLEEKAILKDGICYFDLNTVGEYFNDTFYVDENEGLVLYTTALEVIQVSLGGTLVTTSAGETEELGYIAAFLEGETVYLAADYVRRFTNYSFEVFDRHVQVYTEWGTKVVDTVKKDTAVRLLGGVKSAILCDLSAGDEVEVLESMDTWSKVKTVDSIIGYVENKLLTGVSSGEETYVTETPVADYTEPEYTSLSLDGKLCLGWHSIGGVAGNSTLSEMVAETQGLNVIAPTWFSLSDNEGGFRSYASEDYVTQAHGMGLMVWAVLDDFNYNNETGSNVDVGEVLSHTSIRQKLVSGIVAEAVALGVDGLNIDFEKVTSGDGTHYVQFLRELSIACRENGLYLSVDNYVPYEYRSYYRLDVQGEVVDYVIIMGYDEHWHGSSDPGSVASIDYVLEGITLALESVPAEKLINALPFYTIVWKTTGTDVSDVYLTLNNTADYLSQHGLSPEWDEETCQNYVEWTEGDSLYQIWIEDEESIEVKLNVMSAHNLGGVAVWRLGYGTDAVWSLINAYVQ